MRWKGLRNKSLCQTPQWRTVISISYIVRDITYLIFVPRVTFFILKFIWNEGCDLYTSHLVLVQTILEVWQVPFFRALALIHRGHQFVRMLNVQKLRRPMSNSFMNTWRFGLKKNRGAFFHNMASCRINCFKMFMTAEELELVYIIIYCLFMWANCEQEFQ